MIGIPVLFIKLNTLCKLLFYDLSFLVPDCHPSTLSDVSLAAPDNLIGDLHQEGGHSLWSIVEGGDIVDHLDNVQESHKRLLHVCRVLQVDSMT